MDRIVLYYRQGGQRRGKLLGMVSVHVDDLAVTGSEELIQWFWKLLEGKYGEVKFQRETFKHVGHRYAQQANGAIWTDQIEYVQGIDPPFIPRRVMTSPLDSDELHELRRVNGEMAYSGQGALSFLGRIALSCQGAHGESTIEDLRTAGKVLESMQKDSNPGQVRYEPIPTKDFRLICVSDASLRTGKPKVSQGGYFIVLTENTPKKFGGVCHVLEVSSKKATRVAKSSMAAEILGLCRASEAGQRITAWLHEIWHGVDKAAELIDRNQVEGLTTCLVTDAYDVYLSMLCPRPYQGQDLSMTTYVESLREDLATRRLQEMCWVPTGHMLPDSLTKDMEDKLITALMHSGRWEVPWEEIKLVDSKNLVNLSPGSVHWTRSDVRAMDKDQGCGEHECLCCGPMSRGLSSSELMNIYWLNYLELDDLTPGTNY